MFSRWLLFRCWIKFTDMAALLSLHLRTIKNMVKYKEMTDNTNNWVKQLCHSYCYITAALSITKAQHFHTKHFSFSKKNTDTITMNLTQHHNFIGFKSWYWLKLLNYNKQGHSACRHFLKIRFIELSPGFLRNHHPITLMSINTIIIFYIQTVPHRHTWICKVATKQLHIMQNLHKPIFVFNLSTI